MTIPSFYSKNGPSRHGPSCSGDSAGLGDGFKSSAGFGDGAVANVFEVALGSVTGRLVAHEKQQRAMQAARYRLLYEAFNTADSKGKKAITTASSSAISTNSATVDNRYMSAGRAGEIAYRAVRAELATALCLSERTIERQLDTAYTLCHNYPQALAALDSGVVSDQHVQIVLKAGTVIGAGSDDATVARRTNYTTAALEHAVIMTPARLRPIAERLAEQYSEQTIDERFGQAREQRMVMVTDCGDGMSDLTAHLPSIQAHAIYDRLTRAAKQQETLQAAAAEAEAAGGTNGNKAAGIAFGGSNGATGESVLGGGVSAAPMGANPDTGASEAAGASVFVSRDHRRADLLADLLLRGDTEHLTNSAPITGRVQVTITDTSLFADTLRKLEDTGSDTNPGEGVVLGQPTSLTPAELTGSGMIDTQTARDIAAAIPTWQLVTHHPVTGQVLSVDEYQPTPRMRRMLAARDLHCRFPGCRVVAHRCDIDHTVDHAKGGKTTTTNLAHLCRGHHMLKHHAGWRVKQKPGGVLEWVSPTGRKYTDKPPSKVRFKTITPDTHGTPPKLPAKPLTASQAASQTPQPRASQAARETETGHPF